MATQPTQLPVPSESPRDLKFNAGKIDEFVTSLERTYKDRFGSEHYTIEGIRWIAQQAIAQFGYITIDSFQKGAELTLPNQVLRDESTGEYYRWDGALPKSVPANSTPSSAGGIGAGKWLSVGAAVLSSAQDGAGDALVAVKQPFNGSAVRTQHDKNFDTINLRDGFGVDGTGSTNSTQAIQNVLNSLGLKGGVVNIGNGDRFLCDSLTVPQNVTINGSSFAPGETINSSSQVYSDFGSQFILTPGSTIKMERASCVKNVIVISQALMNKLPITNNATADAAISAFSGKAFTSVEADFQLRDILVIGFEYPLYVNPTATDTGRRVIENFRYDCTNGPYVEYATDIDRFRGVHGWPYLTAHVSGLSASKNNRSGIGFRLRKVADFAYLDCCFNYGYDTGFLFEDVWNITMTGGGADAVTTTGVSYQGNCRFSRIDNFIINSNNTGIAINIVKGPNDPSYNPDVKTNHCIINGVNYGVYVTAGSYFSESDSFMGGVGVAFTDGTVSGGIFNPLFDGVTTPIVMSSAAERVVSRGKFNYSANQPVSTTAEKTFATQSMYYDLRQVDVDVGHFFEQGGKVNSGLQGLSRIGPRLKNATAGSEQADFTVTTFNKGVWVDRFVMTGDGVLRPVADGTQLLGSPSYRWGQIYSSVGTISTSDENEKTEITPVPDAVLDAWSKVDFAMYKLKHAVDGKGADARFHFGLIAQRVKSAFEGAGLDPFAYGILCYDEWDAEGEQVDHDGNVTAPARDAGSRYGIRYDEAWILECALMRRTINELKSAK